jgi:hypothetical protein
MLPGAKVSIADRLIGMLMLPGGARSVHTIEPGSVLTIKSVNDDDGVVEVQLNYLRLLVLRESLEQYGQTDSAR